MRKALPILTLLCLAIPSLFGGASPAFADQQKSSEEKATAEKSMGSGAKHEAAEAKSGEVHDAIELTRDVIKAERKAIIAGTLDMTAKESEAFWPVYRDYENDISKVGDRLLGVIKEYAKNYDTLTDEQAKTMLQDYLKAKEDQLKVRKSYVKRFEKVLPPKKVVRFYQVENKINAAIEFEVAKEIPLVE